MPFVLGKETGGWWLVREISDGFPGKTKAEAIAECKERNKGRLDSKQTTARMAQDEYERAKLSYSTGVVVHHLKPGRTRK